MGVMDELNFAPLAASGDESVGIKEDARHGAAGKTVRARC